MKENKYLKDLLSQILFEFRIGLLVKGFVLLFIVSFFGFKLYALESKYYKAGDQKSELRKVRMVLNWKHQFQFAGYYAAKHKGYYNEAGLDVSFLENEYPDLVFSDSVHFAVNNGKAILDRAKGLPLVIMAPIFQHTARILVTRESSGIFNAHDLIGKKIMMPKNEPYFLAYFKQEGIDVSQLNLIPRDYSYGQLLTGEADASVGYLTDLPMILDRNGLSYRIINPISSGIDFYSEILTTTEDLILEQPELVQAMLEASLKGWEYAMLHKEEIIDLICEEYTKDCDKSLLEYEAEVMDKLIAPRLVDIGHSNMGRWNYIINTYKDLGIIDNDFDADGLFLDDYLVEKTIPIKYIYGSLLILIPLSLSLLFFYLMNRRLRKEVSRNLELNKELQQKERSLRNLVENTNDLLFSLKLNGDILYISESVEEAMGFKVDELQGSNFRPFIHPEDLKKVVSAINELRKHKKKVKGLLLRVADHEGNYHSFLTNMYPSYNEQDEFNQIDGVAVDISQREQYARELQSSKSYAEELLRSYESVLDNNAVYIIKFDQSYRYTYVNHYYAMSFNEKQSDFIKRPIYSMVTSSQAELIQQAVERCVRKPGHSEQIIIETFQENEGYLKGTKWEAKVNKIDSKGNWEILAVGFDITEQLDNLRITGELLEKSKMQNLKLQTFGYVVSHSIRSQASNIAGLLQLISFDHHDQDTNTSFLDMLRTSSTKMDETLTHLNGLLELERDLAAEYRKVNLNQHLAEVLKNPDNGPTLKIESVKEYEVRIIPAFFTGAMQAISDYIYRHSFRNSWISNAALIEHEDKLMLKLVYTPVSEDAVLKGIKSFNPMESRIGNHDSSAIAMYLAHEQLSSMNIPYDLQLLEGKTPKVALTLNFSLLEVVSVA